MRIIIVLAVLVAVASSSAAAGGIIVAKLQGDVAVRQGVTEAWTGVHRGDVLRPDDSMKTGRRGTAVLEVHPDDPARGVKRIVLPPEVIVEMSDIRELSQEELMLKLTMEKVRSSPYRWDGKVPDLPEAAVVHGTDNAGAPPPVENDPAIGKLHMNGSRVLFTNGFYSTCVLRTMEVFRTFPSLAAVFENRVLLARALENTRLTGEALAEYGLISAMPGLNPDELSLVRSKMAALRK
jgi:hypothetical protein